MSSITLSITLSCHWNKLLRPQSWSAMKSSLNCVSFSIFQEKISQSNKKPGSSESLYCIRWLHWRYSLYLDIKNGFNYVKKDSVLRYNKDIPQCPRQWVRWEQEILGASNFLDTIHWLSWFLHESLSNFPLVPGLVSDSQLMKHLLSQTFTWFPHQGCSLSIGWYVPVTLCF